MQDWLTTSTILTGLRDFSHPTAWSRFTERFHRPIVQFARKLGLREADAEDAAQTALITFAERFRANAYDRERGRLRSWLFGIAYRCALDARKKRPADAAQPIDSAVMDALADEDSAGKLWEEEWEQAMLARCLETARRELSDQALRVFEGVVRQGRPAEEVAAELSMTRDAVYVAKHRVLKRLRELAQEYEEPFA